MFQVLLVSQESGDTEGVLLDLRPVLVPVHLVGLVEVDLDTVREFLLLVSFHRVLSELFFFSQLLAVILEIVDLLGLVLDQGCKISNRLYKWFEFFHNRILILFYWGLLVLGFGTFPVPIVISIIAVFSGVRCHLVALVLFHQGNIKNKIESCLLSHKIVWQFQNSFGTFCHAFGHRVGFDFLLDLLDGLVSFGLQVFIHNQRLSLFVGSESPLSACLSRLILFRHLILHGF